MIFGYARVSRRDQNPNLQLDALNKAGCEKVFVDKVSGVKRLPQQEKLLEYLRPGDTIVVWRFDRLGRTPLELIKLVNRFKQENVHFVSITEGIDTRTSIGEFFFIVSAGLAKLERDINIERTNDGLESARERGVKSGRPAGFTGRYKKIGPAVMAAYESKNYTQKELMETFSIPSKHTLYRIINYQKSTKKGLS